MPRSKTDNSEQVTDIDKANETIANAGNNADAAETAVDAKADSKVDKVLKCFPHYEQAYVSEEGFLYPKDAPEYQRGNAKLYKNKYFKK
jgi:hypothetical protein